jgi:hypothetical protein
MRVLNIESSPRGSRSASYRRHRRLSERGSRVHFQENDSQAVNKGHRCALFRFLPASGTAEVRRSLYNQGEK